MRPSSWNPGVLVVRTALVAVATLMSAGSAAAAPSCSNLGTNQVVTFSYTGATQC
jgi:hypothetical protein